MIISIDKNIKKPKYQQIIESIERAVIDKKITKNDKIPSLNQVMKQFGLSQDTVLQAYNDLKCKCNEIFSLLTKIIKTSKITQIH